MMSISNWQPWTVAVAVYVVMSFLVVTYAIFLNYDKLYKYMRDSDRVCGIHIGVLGDVKGIHDVAASNACRIA